MSHIPSIPVPWASTLTEPLCPVCGTPHEYAYVAAPMPARPVGLRGYVSRPMSSDAR